MNRAERRFHVKKNMQDNEYSRVLAYFQMSVVGVITAMVGISIFLMQTRGLAASFATALIFASAGTISFFFFRERLDRISEDIGRLS